MSTCDGCRDLQALVAALVEALAAQKTERWGFPVPLLDVEAVKKRRDAILEEMKRPGLVLPPGAKT